MKSSRKKSEAALRAVAKLRLNGAERLRLAEKLVEGVGVQLAPMIDPVMCVADGCLQAALMGLRQSRRFLDDWHGDLPRPGNLP
jgi:hypothetical protein